MPIPKKIFIVVFMALSILSCNRRVVKNGVGGCLPDSVELKVGDVVLRRGNGFTSHVVLLIDNGGRYSHVGIVVDLAGVKMVCHAVPGEADYDGEPDHVRLCKPEVFFDVMRADAGCVMRYADTVVARCAANEALRICKRGVLFDHDYDSGDTLELYCSEFVDFVFRKAGTSVVVDSLRNHVSEGLKLDNLLLPSHFRNSEYLHLIAEF